MKRDQSHARPSMRGQSGWFTGVVWPDEIAVAEARANLRVHRFGRQRTHNGWL